MNPIINRRYKENNLVSIVVPIYKLEMSEYESISIKQLLKVLGKFDIYFIAPFIIHNELGNIYMGRKVEYFDNIFFADRLSYSRFCLSRVLYERFIHYQYILIHQLDALILSDRLGYFCSLGYDYIGAPHSQIAASKINAIFPSDNGFYVGNGGLSLRNVSKCIDVLQFKTDYFDSAEDSFFTYCGLNPDIDFQIPSVEVAARFSIQGDYDFSVIEEILNGDIPFGLHAWSKPDCFDYTLKYARYALGNSIKTVYPRNDCDTIKHKRDRALRRFLSQRLEEFFSDDEIREILSNYINVSWSYVIWGFGNMGKNLLSLFSNINVGVKMVIDKNADLYEEDYVNPIHPTLESLDSDDMIIVATMKFKDEIVEEIMKTRSSNPNYYIWEDIERDLLEDAFGRDLWRAYHDRLC